MRLCPRDTGRLQQALVRPYGIVLQKFPALNYDDMHHCARPELRERGPQKRPIPIAEIFQPSLPGGNSNARSDPVETRVRDEKAQADPATGTAKKQRKSTKDH